MAGAVGRVLLSLVVVAIGASLTNHAAANKRLGEPLGK